MIKISQISIPLIVWSTWLVGFTNQPRWHLFAENWFMPLTMAVGSFIAGSTSEGGGAVAFPVMTILFEIEPKIARDFSLMIQSVGMSAAAIAIWQSRIVVETRALIFAGVGGALGIVFGLSIVAPNLPAMASKIFFVSLWLSFGVALIWLNRDRHRTVWQRIPNFKFHDALILSAIGFLGGIISAIAGSGLDIITFSLLVLVFRLDEKVATPTSVILMASNALIGFWWRLLSSLNPISTEAWNYWWVSVPIVVVGAPLGARFIAQRSNLFVVRLLLTSIIIQFATALYVLPWNIYLVLFSLATFLTGCALFLGMVFIGSQRLSRQAIRFPLKSSSTKNIKVSN